MYASYRAPCCDPGKYFKSFRLYAKISTSFWRGSAQFQNLIVKRLYLSQTSLRTTRKMTRTRTWIWKTRIPVMILFPLLTRQVNRYLYPQPLDSTLIDFQLRRIIRAVRSSPQRRQAWFRQVASSIQERNAETDEIALMLILDVKTRWSSTHEMLRKLSLPWKLVLFISLNFYIKNAPSFSGRNWTISLHVTESYVTSNSQKVNGKL